MKLLDWFRGGKSTKANTGNSPPVEEAKAKGPFYDGDYKEVDTDDEKVMVVGNTGDGVYYVSPEDRVSLFTSTGFRSIQTRVVWFDLQNKAIEDRQMVLFTQFDPNNTEHLISVGNLIWKILAPTETIYKSKLKLVCGLTVIDFNPAEGYILFRTTPTLLAELTDNISLDNAFRRSLNGVVVEFSYVCQTHKEEFEDKKWEKDIYAKTSKDGLFPIIILPERLEQLGFSDEEIELIINIYLSSIERRNNVFPVVIYDTKELRSTIYDVHIPDEIASDIKKHITEERPSEETTKKFKNISSGKAMFELVDELIPGSESEE